MTIYGKSAMRSLAQTILLRISYGNGNGDGITVRDGLAGRMSTACSMQRIRNCLRRGICH